MACLTLAPGFAPSERPTAARLFWQAFGPKLRPVLAPDEKALAFLSAALCPRYALSARDAQGRLLGLAGVKTAEGGLVGGTLRDIAEIYRWPGALWRGPLLSLLEREVAPDTLLMDGIFVSEEARGRGVGSALLGAVKQKARSEGLASVRLDVVDSNPRARALYERHGFVAGKRTDLGVMRHVFGFTGSTEMRCDLTAELPQRSELTLS